LLSYRRIYFLAFLLCCALLLFALYLQYAKDIEPCLLCMMQRFIVIVLAVVFFIASLHRHNRASRWIYNIIAMAVGILGLLSALRQVWLQSLPPSSQAVCVPGYSFLVKTAAWKTLFKYLVVGTPECSHVEWTFLHLSIAQWSVGFFVFFIAVIAWQMARKR
jgi:protein dithiol:quinone oxidoreductase